MNPHPYRNCRRLWQCLEVLSPWCHERHPLKRCDVAATSRACSPACETTLCVPSPSSFRSASLIVILLYAPQPTRPPCHQVSSESTPRSVDRFWRDSLRAALKRIIRRSPNSPNFSISPLSDRESTPCRFISVTASATHLRFPYITLGGDSHFGTPGFEVLILLPMLHDLSS